MSLRIWSPSAAGAEIVTALGEGERLVEADADPHVVIVDDGASVPVAPGARLYTVAPTRIAEIEMTIVEIAAIIGTPARAPDVVDSIQKPIESVLAAVIDQPRPTVHVALAGAWIPDMVAMAGGAPVPADEADLVVIAEGDPPPGGRRIVAVDPGYYAVAGPRVAYGIVQLGFLLHPTRLVDPQLPLTEVIP